MLKIIKSRTLIFLVFIGLSYLLPDIYQDILGFLLILSIGVIHGANDLLIIKKYTRKDSLKSQISYFLYYVGLVFLGFVFFYVYPSIALMSFVLVSIYHFGEQHWEANSLTSNILKERKIFPIILHGLTFFLIIFINNIEVVNEVLASFNTILIDPFVLGTSLTILFSVYMLMLLSFKIFRGYFLPEFLFFLLLYLLTMNSTLIYAFSIYLSLIHI